MKNIDAAAIKANYDRDGYVFIPGFLSREEVERINNELKSFIAERIPDMLPAYVFYEDKNDPATLKQLQDLHQYHSFFAQKISWIFQTGACTIPDTISSLKIWSPVNFKKALLPTYQLFFLL